MENKSEKVEVKLVEVKEKKSLSKKMKEFSEEHPKLVKAGKVVGALALGVGAFFLGKEVGLNEQIAQFVEESGEALSDVVDVSGQD